MKRWTTEILLLLILCLLSSCGQSAEAQWQEQYDLGMRYLSDGNYEEAIIAFTAAIEIDPKRPEAFVGRGDAYIGSGETEENLAAALTDYEAALALDETLPEAWLGLADVYIRRGDYDKALEVLKEALDKTGNRQAIADKVTEMEDGEDRDASGVLRRSREFMNGILHSVSYYDAKGRITCMEVYNTDGTINNSNEFQYSEDGRTKTQYVYIDDHVLLTVHIYTYREDGKLEREDIYDIDEDDPEQYRYHQYSLWEYNEQGQSIRETIYFDDGSMRSYSLYEYDDSGLLKRINNYESNGAAAGYTAYEYDEAGNRVRTEILHPDGTIDVLVPERAE